MVVLRIGRKRTRRFYSNVAVSRLVFFFFWSNETDGGVNGSLCYRYATDDRRSWKRSISSCPSAHYYYYTTTSDCIIHITSTSYLLPFQCRSLFLQIDLLQHSRDRVVSLSPIAALSSTSSLRPILSTATRSHTTTLVSFAH
jgi:hypothetical protein